MKLHFAAAESHTKTLYKCGVKNLLITMATSTGRHCIKVKLPEIYTTCPYNLTIDSGAFTFYRTGGIVLDNWVKQAVELKSYGNEIIALDVIGDAKQTWENYNEIIKTIPNAIPTFHLTSDLLYLKKYMNITNRIAIGGMVMLGARSLTLINELNKVFALVNKTNVPKFHAFGIFNDCILQNFPFYSCDASSWQQPGNFGSLTFFDGKKIRCPSKKVLKKTDSTVNYKVFFEHYSIGNAWQISNYLAYEKHVTDLWLKRGITWGD